MFARSWIYLQDRIISAKVKLRQFQKNILDRWWRSQGVEDGEDERMVTRYSMQSHGASLVFLRTSGEFISEEYALDYSEDMWESGCICMCYCIT